MKYNKSKIRVNIRVLFLIMVMSATSCNDFLDKYPLDEISEETFWKSSSDLDLYMRGKYEWLPGLDESRIGDYQSDDMIRGDFEGGHSQLMNGERITTNDAGEGGWDWSPIREINYFLDNYSKCEASFEEYHHFVGEAQFFKVMKYHELVSNFGDVPWYENVIEYTDEDQLNKPRDSRSFVMDKIMVLIDEAVENLKTRDEVGVNRINKESALILKSRIALFEATWAKYHQGTPSASDVNADAYFQMVVDAYKELQSLIGGDFSSHIYSTGNPESDYYNLFNRTDYSGINEVTLSRDYNYSLGTWNQMCWRPMRGYFNRGYTLDLVQSYLTKEGNTIDITDEALFPEKGSAWLAKLAIILDPRFEQSVFDPGDMMSNVGPMWLGISWTIPGLYHDAGYYSPTGFDPQKGHNPDVNTDGVEENIDGISFRVGEILLNYAEAYVELNGSLPPDMDQNLDLLRARVGMPPLASNMPIVNDNWPDYGYTVTDLLAIVRQERRVELVGENFRQDDWRRWRAHALFQGERPRGYKYLEQDFIDYNDTNDPDINIPTVMIDEMGYIDTYKNAVPNGYGFRPEMDYLSSIPIQEIVRNPNLVQNPGWITP